MQRKRETRGKQIVVALKSVTGVGSKMIQDLLNMFDCPEDILRASERRLCRVPRLTSEIADAIRNINLGDVQTKIAEIESSGTVVITIVNEEYPESLRELADSPPVLFRKGQYVKEDRKAIAIAGTRKPTDEGRNISRTLGKKLAKCGFTIVSGLATGIDTAAHIGALEANGRTIAVLGSGINIIHPSQNKNLAGKIIKSGSIFSEVWPNTRPAGSHLMARDRIVSGLSEATIIVESSLNSGSLDTAEKTKKQGRLLLVVDNETAGNQKLINEGSFAIPDTSDKSINSITEKVNAFNRNNTDEGEQLSLF